MSTTTDKPTIEEIREVRAKMYFPDGRPTREWLYIDVLLAEVQRLMNGLEQIAEGMFRYNMGDYEMCAKNAARLALRKDL